jgi:hypothetical protein
VSLMYGDQPVAVKQQLIAEIGSEFDLTCALERLQLVATDGQPKDWYRVAEFSLK